MADKLTFNQKELALMNFVLQAVDAEGKTPRTFSLEGQALALSIFNKLKATAIDGRFPEEAPVDFTKEEKTRLYEYLKEFKVTLLDIEAKTTLLDKLK